MDWSYFDKFDDVCDKYLPVSGEGETIATQIITAVCKLVYKWYNDGDVFDNTHFLKGWANDLSSYANWLRKYTESARYILDNIDSIKTNEEYEQMLADLADILLKDEYLESMLKEEKIGSVYNCDGPYEFVQDSYDEEYDEEYDYDSEDFEEDEQED